MNHLSRFILISFARLIRWYPRRFRDEFGDEMERVFGDLVMESARQGIFSLLGVSIRELFSLPLSILAEIWHEMEPREAIMATGLQGTSGTRLPASWSQAFLAGLPHVCFAALIGLGSVLPDTVSGYFLGWSMIALVVIGFILAFFFSWRSQWPTWGASWYGYAGILVLILATLPGQGWNPPISVIIDAAGSLLLLGVTLLTLRYWLTRRDPIEGMLVGLPVIIIYWVPLMEFIQYPLRTWLVLSMFLVSALGAGLILRENNVSKGIWILLGVSVAAGLPLALARTYWYVTPAWVPPAEAVPPEYFDPASLHQVMRLFSGQFLAGTALALGPILGWGVWRLGKMYDPIGRLAAGLLISGMAVNLFGLYSYWRWFEHVDYFDALGLPFLYKPDGALSVFMIYAGLIGIAVGGFCLGALAWRRNPLLGVSMGLSGLLIPHLAMIQVYSGFHISMPGIPLALNALSPTVQSAVFELAILLVILIGWVIAQLYREPQPSTDSQ